MGSKYLLRLSDTTGAKVLRNISNAYGWILYETAIKVDSFSNLRFSTVIISVLSFATFAGGCLWKARQYRKGKSMEKTIKSIGEQVSMQDMQDVSFSPVSPLSAYHSPLPPQANNEVSVEMTSITTDTLPLEEASI